MASNYGSGVSRVLDPTNSSFTNVIWQEGKPPLDAELNLLQDLAQDFCRKVVLRGTPSGWLGNETNTTEDFVTNPLWSNWLQFGRQRTGERAAIQWAVVNGWLVPVTGTRTGTPPGSPNDTDTWNILALDPPPSNSGDSRIDFAFLEVWLARVPSNPSTLNKPAANSIYRYGNVESGNTFLSDDLTDPSLGFETTQRIQVQYRIRVVKGLVGLTSYPDGFDPVVVKAQGSGASPTNFVFTNMRQTLGDVGLWRAGDGVSSNTLGTVDGYVYAIPITAVFRRNSVAWNGDPAQNLNGAFNRNPTAVDRTGIKTFAGTVTLAADLSAGAVSVQLTSATNIALPSAPALPVLIQIGDELLTYSSVSGTPPILGGLTRGVNGSRAEKHKAGSVVKVLSGRPDGLFSDQIAMTDIYDLRHLVNPNGFDYDALLKSNFDKLLRGQMRANWKRSGAGPQGTVAFYQDKIVNGASSLGVTKIDGPDNIRLIFSDAAVTQPVEVIVAANAAPVPSAINVAWSLTLNANHTVRATTNTFSPTDVIVVPVAQLKAGLPGGDVDQVRWVNDTMTGGIVIRINDSLNTVDPSLYVVTPANPGPSDDLTITLGANFPLTTNQLYITLHVMYGPGRGLSRRPDALHSVAFLNPSTELLLQTASVPLSNQGLRTSWFPLWSKFRETTYRGLVPVTAETFADLGSKTVVVTPFRRIDWPDDFRTKDGTGANLNTASFVSGTLGVGDGTTTFTDASKNFTALGVVAGDVLTVTAGANTGKYPVQSVAPGGDTTKLVLGTTLPIVLLLNYSIYHAQGVMPLLKKDGVTAKWTTTDPLQLFSGTTEAQVSTKNIYVTLPRHLVPGWGAFYVPVLWQDTAVFAEGINFMLISKKGSSPFADTDKNYCPYSNGPLTYGVFSTLNFNPPGNPATYNTSFSFGGKTFAGLRFFTDTRGLGRKGLEMPPFYGITRLFAIYEAEDYKLNGSAYDATTRNATGIGAVNLLRQNFDGPTFWVEIDEDGDSTFILNADAIDLSRSPNAIANFAAGHYAIEANIFGFDRGSFDITKDFRLVLTRPTSAGLMRSQAADAVIRANNIGVTIAGPVSVLPGPATNSDQIVVNYSRTVYQGDAWGSQTSHTDIGYAPGPLQSGTAFQVASTSLDAANLTRPNQKVFEVLASCGFATTLGTGRFTGDYKKLPASNLADVGREDTTAYPPVSALATRPRVLLDAFTLETSTVEVGTDYLGCSERLPLGALFRDKDFVGGTFGSNVRAPLVLIPETGFGFLTSQSNAKKLEQTEVNVSSASTATGSPGDILVHVDGEQGNYALLSNFRTYRGGSLFCASGSHPGGEVAVVHPDVKAPQSGNLISGLAFLVRNAVTSVGATEVSAGDELMIIVVTTVMIMPNDWVPSFVVIGTNGSQEGYSAADIYRIDGHPIVRNNGRYFIDPSSIPLTLPVG